MGCGKSVGDSGAGVVFGVCDSDGAAGGIDETDGGNRTGLVGDSSGLDTFGGNGGGIGGGSDDALGGV